VLDLDDEPVSPAQPQGGEAEPVTGGRHPAGSHRPRGGGGTSRKPPSLRVWDALGLRTESSYTLCERLCILGILGEEASVIEFVEGPVRPLLEHPSQPGRAFVLLADGRVLAQIGRPTEVIEHLGSKVPWAHAPGHVQARWLSFAQRAAGLSGQAASTLEALEHLGDVDQLHLARLDDALLQGTVLAGLAPLIQKLLDAEEGGDEARRLLLTMTSGHDAPRSLRDRSVVERLCREYRYLPQARKPWFARRFSRARWLVIVVFRHHKVNIVTCPSMCSRCPFYSRMGRTTSGLGDFYTSSLKECSMLRSRALSIHLVIGRLISSDIYL
jgi:hypothetical protein